VGGKIYIEKFAPIKNMGFIRISENPVDINKKMVKYSYA